jgi:AcrR family transcriptional regulator
MKAARQLFVQHGYGETSTPDIVARARITRGALYHHFADKRALFRAVLEEEARAVAAHIEASTHGIRDPLTALLMGSDAYLEAMTVAGRTRLLLLDGPAVLGVLIMQEIDEASSAFSLREGLGAVMRKPRGVSLERLAPLLSAAFDRAALDVDAGATLPEAKTAMRFLLTRTVGAP